MKQKDTKSAFVLYLKSTGKNNLGRTIRQPSSAAEARASEGPSPGQMSFRIFTRISWAESQLPSISWQRASRYLPLTVTIPARHLKKF